MARRRRARLLGVKIPPTRSRAAEIEYGLKEFVQGLLVGFILGILVATQLL